MNSSRIMHAFPMRFLVAAVLMTCALALPARAGVWLSSYSFAADSLPTISSDEIASAQSSAGPGGYYKLRAKIIIGVAPGYYHATDGLNNNGQSLTSTPGTGTYPIELYWASYNSSGVLQSTGPVSSHQVTITAPSSGSTGLKADYYNGKNFDALVRSANGENIDVDWQYGGPQGLGVDNFSVRWMGYIEPTLSETYTFYAGSDDGIRLYIGDMNTPVAQAWSDHGYFEATGTKALVAGQRYPIKVEFYESGGGATARLFWQSPSLQRQIVPVTRLFPTSSGSGSQAPTIVTHPTSQPVTVGGIVTFSVVVNGSPQPSLQWRKGGTIISGAVGTSYTISSAQLGDAGSYDVVVANSLGSVTSNSATLTVNSGSSPGTGTGLRGEYYNGTSFSGVPISRVDGTIDFGWGNGAPMSGINADNFQVRWTGQVEAPVAGYYTFSTNSDDGVRLKLAGSTIIDDWNVHGETDRYSAQIYLNAGEKRDIILEYFEANGGATVRLYWQVPGQGTRVIIPSSRLYSTPNNGGGGGWTSLIAGSSHTLNFSEGTDEEGNGNGEYTSNLIQVGLTVPGAGRVRVYTTGSADTLVGLINPFWNFLVPMTDNGGSGGNGGFEIDVAGGNYHILIQGNYQYHDNENTTLYAEFLPATSAPIITIASSPIAFFQGAGFQYQIVANNSPQSYGSAGLPAGLVLNTSTGLISGQASQSGNYGVTLYATNGAGTGSAAIGFQITPVNPPDWTSTVGPATATVGSTVDYTFTIHDSDGDLTHMEIAWQTPAGSVYAIYPWFAVASGSQQSVTRSISFNQGVGVYKLWVNARDSGGRVRDPWGQGLSGEMLTVTVSTNSSPTVPVITSGSSATGTAGTAFSGYTATASGGGTMAFSATSLPPGLSIVSGSGAVTGTPSQAGSYVAQISATNSAGTGSKAVTFTIQASGGSGNGPVGTGGTISRVGDYLVHTFTSGGTFSIPSAITYDVLLVGGGGGGQSNAGGGGGGGFRHLTGQSLSSGSHSVVVGAGGGIGASGGNSSFASTVASGGGGGGLNGASGGGARRDLNGPGGAAIHGDQGYNGGAAEAYGWCSSGGGGGAGGPGQNGRNMGGFSGGAYQHPDDKGGDGGPGRASSITGTAMYYGGGGGGTNESGYGVVPAGGVGGGGSGSKSYGYGGPGTNGLGGGGGASAVGGSGVVIIRYYSPVTSSPVITSGGVASGMVGTSFTGYTATATGGGTITFTATNLPPGLQINGTSGSLTGTPTEAGTYDAQIVASNTVGAGTKTVIFTIASAPNSPPSIKAHPNTQSVAAGNSATLSVVAVGSDTLTYQWYRNGTAISGATSSSFTVTNFQVNHTGAYHAVVTNGFGSAASNAGTLTVTSAGGGNSKLPSAKDRSPNIPGLISSVVGGSGYDIQSGAIVRSVRDFEVNGSVGAYPLQMTRVYTRENKSLSGTGWSHSFIWFANENVDGYWPLSSGLQNLYIYTPDGQYLHFQFRGDDTPSEFFQSANGIRVQATRDANKRIESLVLVFSDGGSVVMPMSRDVPGARQFRASVLTDPFGLVTNFTYPDAQTALPQQVTDASGRWLKFFGSIQYITRVESSDGKWININGVSGVSYWDGTSATYTRTPLTGGATPGGDGTAAMRFSDVRQTSGMKDVEYVLQKVHYGAQAPQVPTNWGDDPYEWEVVSERYPNAAAGAGTIVSSRTVLARQQSIDGVGTLPNGPAISARETRGDGATRLFTFGGSPAYYMSSATDFRGNISYFQNWSGNVPSTIIDRLGNQTLVESGSWGEIKKITFPGGAVRSYGFSGQYLISETDERGFVTYYDRDAQHRVWRIRYPESSQETYTYNARNQITSHVLPNGSTEHWEYSTSALAVKYWPATTLGAIATAPKVTYTHYSSPNASVDLVQTETDPRGNVTTFEYNSRNQVTKETLPGGAYREYGYDAQGNRLWAENELRKRTTNTYDEYNRLTTVTDALGNVTTHTYETTSGANALVHTASAIRRTTLPGGVIIANKYDNDYNVVETIRGEGTADAATVTMQYDAASRMTKKTEAVDGSTNRITDFRYDSRHRKTHEDAPLSRTTQWHYDLASNVEKITSPDGSFVSKSYDGQNRITSVTDERLQVTSYSYHASGKVNVITDPRGHTYTHGYNSRDQLTSRTYPGGSTETWGHDSAGNVSYYINRSNQRLDYTYDARNRETDRIWVASAAPSVSTGYDLASRVTSRSNSVGTLGYGYDDAGRLTSTSQAITGAPTVSAVHGYNGRSQRNSFTPSSGGALSYEYNYRGILKEIKQSSSVIASYLYDGTDRRTSRTSLNGVVGSYGYDGAGRLTSINTYLGSASNGILSQRFGYDLRDRRNWTLRDENLGDTYEYYLDGQLHKYRHSLSRPDQNVNNPAAWTDTFAYDAAGNRSSLNENGVVTSYAADALNQYSSITGTTISHADGRGNTTQWGSWSYAYNAENQMVSATQSGVVIQFAYDAEGRLAKVDRNGVAEYRYYDGLQCYLRTDSAGSVTDWTIWGETPDEVVARQAVSGWQYYHQDAINSTIAVTNAAGAVLERYLYDPFGEPDIRDGNWGVRSGTAISNPWLFTGQEWRGEMQASNYKNRWYNPRMGRFLHTDPIRFDGGDVNLYRYCFNDPINRIDPDGQFAFLALIPLFIGTTVWVNAPGPEDKIYTGGADVTNIPGLPSIKTVGDLTKLTLKEGARKTLKGQLKNAEGNGGQRELHRPYIRKDVRAEIEARAPRTADGRPIDPNTLKPIDGKADLGHKTGHEFRTERDKAKAEGLNQKQFSDRMNNPDLYQLEDPSSNRSHRYEKKR